MIPLLRTPAEVRTFVAKSRSAGRTVGFVPTMGALHAGHAALVTHAAGMCDDVIVSVFVNPLQFDDPDDLLRYPRDIEHDTAVAARAGAAAVYAPTVDVVYPEGFDTTVVVGRTAEALEGVARPGHFRGVATVVCKLLNTVSPDVAVFGMKDRQQLAVVARMVMDLDMNVRIIGHDTVREPDGVAMSSRNTRLSPAGRAAARIIPRAFRETLERFHAGERDAGALLGAFSGVIACEPAASLEYVALSDGDDLSDVGSVTRPAFISCAVVIDGVRLIDNMDLVP